MQETTQQYTKRILGYVEGKKPLDVLAATPKQIARLIKGATKKKLAKRPAPDKWSVAEILAHLADAELVSDVRVRFILGSSGIAIQGYDQNAWASFSDYASHDPLQSQEAFRVNRERTVRLLKSIPAELWNNYGLHSERGKETVGRLVEMMAGHDVNHMKQIAQILEG